jgi:glycosyltransferase involved in cell wall biosynthesis
VQFNVVIPTYNRAASVLTAVRSALAQSYEHVTVVVVDDGSSDNTEAVIEEFGDARVSYVRQPNRGPSAARNAGAAAAPGDALVFLDSDDELLPEALAHFAEKLRDHDIVLGGWTHVSADASDQGTIVPDPALVARTRFGPFQSGAFAITTAFFHACGGFDELLRYSENTDFGWRVREHLAPGRSIGVVEAPVVKHNRQAERPYDTARYDAARRILATRAYEKEADPGDARAVRGFRSNYLAIAAVSAARLGKRGEAVGYAVRALCLQPLSKARHRTVASVARHLATRPRFGRLPPENEG